MKIHIADGESFEAEEGKNLYELLKKNKIYLTASCGGKGSCGKCRVIVKEGTVRVESYGKLTTAEREQGIVLACQSFPEGDITIEIPIESMLTVGDKIAVSRTRDLFELLKSYKADISPLISRIRLTLPVPTLDDNISDLERLKRGIEEKGLVLEYPYHFVSNLSDSLREHDWNFILCYQKESNTALSIEPPVEKPCYHGIAVDIGTTTVVVYLVDLCDGRVIDVGSTYNSQMRYGDDVITRIVHATEGGGLKELRHAVVNDINDLIRPLTESHGIDPEGIESVVVSGNTTMVHLFWGLNPAYIREEPYIPTANRFPVWQARDAGIKIRRDAPVYSVPCVASYVGGDIVSGVIATKMHTREELSLFMDIGTNGEIVIGNKDWLMTAACSAGPCFEGGGIKNGMRATNGAIESVRIDPETLEPEFKVIGDVSPIGICGSGMIDAITEMFLAGIVDQKGRIRDDLKTDRIREGEDGLEYLLYSGETHDIVLTQVDIENLIRAKGAIYAGASLLLKEVGFTFDMIERVYIAGGFGNYIDVEKAVIMGMLPDIPRDRFRFMGNTSIAGAYLCLMSEEMRREAERVASMMTYMELSTKGTFMDEFMSALFLPHTEMEQFPSVKELVFKER
ncbi:MAG: DUF4445 domain-containing protein [Nitrospirae bacterium]|nr:DUF4445 domain-containing protein [Nitrospirota bacterium]